MKHSILLVISILQFSLISCSNGTNEKSKAFINQIRIEKFIDVDFSLPSPFFGEEISDDFSEISQQKQNARTEKNNNRIEYNKKYKNIMRANDLFDKYYSKRDDLSYSKGIDSIFIYNKISYENDNCVSALANNASYKILFGKEIDAIVDLENIYNKNIKGFDVMLINNLWTEDELLFALCICHLKANNYLKANKYFSLLDENNSKGKNSIFKYNYYYLKCLMLASDPKVDNCEIINKIITQSESEFDKESNRSQGDFFLDLGKGEQRNSDMNMLFDYFCTGK